MFLSLFQLPVFCTTVALFFVRNRQKKSNTWLLTQLQLPPQHRGPQSNDGGTLHIPPSPPLLTCFGSVVSTYVCVSQRYLTVVVPCTVTLPQHNNFLRTKTKREATCVSTRKKIKAYMGGVYTCCIHEVGIREGGYGIW